jgi:uncharacterized membrane protein
MTTSPAEPVAGAQPSAIRGTLDDLVSRLEKNGSFDGLARASRAVVRAVVPAGLVPLLRGEPLGHPLHPALVAGPIGFWSAASLLDLTGGDATAARRLVAIGTLAALPTAASGAVEWADLDPDTAPEAFRVGFVHAVLNDVALLVYLASWRARRREHRARGAALALFGSGVLTASGWLGGHLAYRRGVGVSSP